MNRTDFIVQSIAVVIVLSIMNGLLFHDGLIAAVLFSCAIVACYWTGRLSVRLARRLRRPKRLLDE